MAQIGNGVEFPGWGNFTPPVAPPSTDPGQRQNISPRHPLALTPPPHANLQLLHTPQTVSNFIPNIIKTPFPPSSP